MTLTWDGLFHPTSSFGVLSTRFVEELAKLGVDVRIDPWSESKGPYSDPIREAMMRKRDGPVIRVTHPNGAVPGTIPFVFFEDSELTCAQDDLERTVNTLRTFPLVLVSSHYCRRTLKAYGVKSEVVPLGSDIEPIHWPVTDPPAKPYTFLCVAAAGRRKGLDLLSRAFNEIAPGRHVKLVLKSESGPEMQLGNVEWVSGSLSQAQMVSLYERHADCFVLPTRGEAFCLPALDAAKAGLPVIVTGWGGQTDFTDPRFHIRYNLLRRDDGAGGLWAEPDLEHLKKLMIECYEKRPKPGPLDEWTWGNAAEILLDTLRGADLL